MYEYLVAVYILLCMIYAGVWGHRHSSYQEAFCRFVFAVFIPIVSFIFFYIMDRAPHYTKQQVLDKYYIGDEEGLEDLAYLKPVDRQQELSKVPMDEVLSINDYHTRRKAVMDTLQYDALEYLDSLQKALNNDDTETSHYATAVIMDIQNKLNTALIDIKLKYNKDPNDKDNIVEYEQALGKIVFSNFFDERNLMRYYAEYKLLSDRIFESSQVDEIFYNNRIQYDFKVKDFTNAYKVCNDYKQAYPNSEAMVICNMKYYVMVKDRQKLDEFLMELKGLPVKLTQDSLQYIRFLTN